MDNNEPKQLKLGGEKKEKEPKANKLVLLAILMLTVVASLAAYWIPRFRDRGSGIRDQNSEIRGQNGGVLGRPKVIEF